MIDYDKIIKKFRDAHGDTYTYPDLREAPNTKAKITIICPKHGEFSQRLSLHYTSGCKKCGIEKMKASKISSSDKVIGKFKEVHGDKYNYDKVVYKSMHDKVTITCPEHGDFIQSANNHAHGSICPKCALDNRYDAEELKSDFIQKSGNRFPDRFTYDKVDYTDNKIHVTITCKIHGDFNQRPNDHLASVWGCPKCANDRMRNNIMTDDVVRTKLMDIYGDNTDLDFSNLNYTGSYDPITIGCKVHGRVDVLLNNLMKGNGCPKCSNNGTSNAEQDVASFIDSLNVRYIVNDRRLLNGKELDILLPDHKLAIEFNGLYWHSTDDIDSIGVFERKHIHKTELCERNNIQLMHIFEHEWVDKSDIWKSMIKHKLKLSDRIFARNCEIKTIDKGMEKEFFENNHLQGFSSSRDAIGLFYNGGIVAAMSFKAGRFNNSSSMEIVRFSNKLNTTVVGGFSKLLSHYKKHHRGEIISYANRRWSMGGVYNTNGLEFVRYTDPNYAYLDKSARQLYSRQKFQKHKLERVLDNYDQNMTEKENMLSHGYRILYDSGNILYRTK